MRSHAGYIRQSLLRVKVAESASTTAAAAATKRKHYANRGVGENHCLQESCAMYLRTGRYYVPLPRGTTAAFIAQSESLCYHRLSYWAAPCRGVWWQGRGVWWRMRLTKTLTTLPPRLAPANPPNPPPPFVSAITFCFHHHAGATRAPEQMQVRRLPITHHG